MVRSSFRSHITNTNKSFRLTLCNICLSIFLALKNTPLSPLAGRSYESINVLRRCVGYTTILYMILHSTTYIGGLAKSHSLFLLVMPGQYAAVFAGFCFLTIGITASSFFRKRQYELFFIVHVTLVVGILTARKFHPKDRERSKLTFCSRLSSQANQLERHHRSHRCSGYVVR